MTGLTFGEAARRLQCDVNVIRRSVRTELCQVIVDGRRKRLPGDWVAEQLERLGQ